MSQFIDDVSAWHQLMCMKTCDAFQGNELRQIREDRVLALTARYIRGLQTIQQQHDEISCTLASRVRTQLCGDLIDDQTLEHVCNRFLAGVGMTLRREIPSDIQRSKRAKIRKLTLDWTSRESEASWEGSGNTFPLRELLLFCAAHSGGADETVAQVIANQLLDDLRRGSAAIPRLNLVSHDHRQSLLEWTTAVVALEGGTAPVTVEGSDVLEPTDALTIVIEDTGRQFEHEIHQSSLRGETPANSLTVEATLAIDEADEPDPDSADARTLTELVRRAVEQNGENEDKMIELIARSSILGVSAAILGKEPQAIIKQRIAVVKHAARLRRARRRPVTVAD
jgi:hypothetical protein